MAGVTLHTRIVRTARVALPLLALALLSSLFILTQSPDPDAAIPTAGTDLDILINEQRLTNPRFTGVSAAGAAFSITADLARPDPEDPKKLSADSLTVSIDGLSGGNQLFVQAGRGQVDTGARLIQLARDVDIRSSLGIEVQTDQMMGDMIQMEIYAPDTLTGQGPFGDLTAGAMRLTRDVATGQQLLLFEDGVILLYQPE
jgi:lipopolysaccharide export system protein LptC